MKYNRIFLYLFLLAIPTMVYAQRKRTKAHAKQPVEVVEEETPGEKMFKSMLSSTAKIMFVDSMVVDKASFLSQIPLNKESGKVMRYQDFFTNKAKTVQRPTSVYINEFGDQAYYAEGDTVNGNVLYKVDWLGDNWGPRTAVEGIGEGYQEINYPFVMSDGVTLFFAAKGENSIGGYDIFTTLFDSESGTFYQPENYGLPFNSEANDYFLAINEIDNIGWLVSDRGQEAGKVCIYTFVPTNPRVGFESDNMTANQIEPYARITRIADTWKFGNRKEALQRIENMLARENTESDPDRIYFVVNDEVTYYNINEFKSKKNRQQFLVLNGMKASKDKKVKDLEALREQYRTANASKQAELREYLLRTEREMEELYASIHDMEKTIRNEEIRNIQK